jgi:hypothetical protein
LERQAVQVRDSRKELGQNRANRTEIFIVSQPLDSILNSQRAIVLFTLDGRRGIGRTFDPGFKMADPVIEKASCSALPLLSAVGMAIKDRTSKSIFIDSFAFLVSMIVIEEAPWYIKRYVGFLHNVNVLVFAALVRLWLTHR